MTPETPPLLNISAQHNAAPSGASDPAPVPVSELPASRNSVLRLARKLAILVLGTIVLIVGVIMIVGPGPAFIVIPAGLAILATEFVWARRVLDRLRARVFSK